MSAPDYEAIAAAGDITVTSAHRSALRRIERGEPVADLGECLGALYLHGLVRDVEGVPALTDEGRGMLRVHDELGLTRRIERPRLESRPLPAGWRHDGHGLTRDDLGWRVPIVPDATALVKFVAQQRSLLDALEWMGHELAVRAQDGAS